VKYLSLFILVGYVANAAAITLEACGKSVANGGVQSTVISASFTSANWDDNWKEIAENVQKALGNNAAYDSAVGIHITFNVRVFGFPAPLPPLTLFFGGRVSIEKAILNQINDGIDLDEDDPNPCDPSKNESNGAQSNVGGGDGGGGGGSSGGGGTWSPIGGGGGGGNPCANGRCTVIIEQEDAK